jgi:hypothetical protein
MNVAHGAEQTTSSSPISIGGWQMMAIFRRHCSVTVQPINGNLVSTGSVLGAVTRIPIEVDVMRKILTAVAAAALIGVTALASSSPANAWGRWGWGWGPGPFWGGVAAGAVVGGAIAASPYYYRPYYPYPYYGYGYGCRPVWNGYGWVRGYC